MLPTEPSPEGLQLGDFMFVQRGVDILKFDKNPLNCSASYFWFIVLHISRIAGLFGS